MSKYTLPLSKEARAELKAKYYDIYFKNPNGNMSDANLLKAVEQHEGIETANANAPKEQDAPAPAQTPSPSPAGNENAPVETSAPVEQDAQEVERYFKNFGKKPLESMKTAQIKEQSDLHEAKLQEANKKPEPKKVEYNKATEVLITNGEEMRVIPLRQWEHIKSSKEWTKVTEKPAELK